MLVKNDTNILRSKLDDAHRRIDNLERSTAALNAQLIFLRDALDPQSLETMMALRIGAITV